MPVVPNRIVVNQKPSVLQNSNGHARTNGSVLSPFWQTTDRSTVRLYLGDVVSVLQGLPAKSVQCVVTSPPYWGLRSYNTGDAKHQEIGCEKTPEEFVAKMVEVFSEVRRVLRDDGTCWLNLGDTYAGSSMTGGSGGYNAEGTYKSARMFTRPGAGLVEGRGANRDGAPACALSPGNLVGVPWRVALALQADGWVLRQDLIWCLSGGTKLYARCQTGDKPLAIRDISRLDPSTVQLWNGKAWTQLLGTTVTKRKGDELEILLRSGEDIGCSPTHKFPTVRGLLAAKDLKVGDVLTSCQLPEPETARDSEHLGLDAAWFAGLYLAEGCNVDKGKIQLTGHSNETARWERVQRIVSAYGGTCSLRINGNVQNIRVYSRMLCAAVKELISGKTCKDKGLSQLAWQYSNNFIETLLLGYLEGDGHWDEENQRWRVSFARNCNLESSLRTACSRLGWLLTLNSRMALQATSGERFPSFRGEIRVARRSDGRRLESVEKSRNEIVSIKMSSCREVYDVGVADEPHLFSLASGVLTHNSKPSPMPESVKNRCTKAHEYVFLLTKSMDYFMDMDAIRETAQEHRGEVLSNRESGTGLARGMNGQADRQGNEVALEGKSNKRSVWRVSSQGYAGAHFATFPPKLIEPMILAGTSEKGACADCGAPWKRVVEERKLTRERPNDYVKRSGEDGTGSSCANSVAGVETKTLGWEPTCTCPSKETRPCIVLDPFIGSGTTCCVSIEHGRNSIGIDLSEEYLRENAMLRIEGELLSRPGLFDLVPPKENAGPVLVGRELTFVD